MLIRFSATASPKPQFNKKTKHNKNAPVGSGRAFVPPSPKVPDKLHPMEQAERHISVEKMTHTQNKDCSFDRLIIDAKCLLH